MVAVASTDESHADARGPPPTPRPHTSIALYIAQFQFPSHLWVQHSAKAGTRRGTNEHPANTHRSQSPTTQPSPAHSHTRCRATAETCLPKSRLRLPPRPLPAPRTRAPSALLRRIRHRTLHALHARHSAATQIYPASHAPHSKRHCGAACSSSIPDPIHPRRRRCSLAHCACSPLSHTGPTVLQGNPDAEVHAAPFEVKLKKRPSQILPRSTRTLDPRLRPPSLLYGPNGTRAPYCSPRHARNARVHDAVRIRNVAAATMWPWLTNENLGICRRQKISTYIAHSCLKICAFFDAFFLRGAPSWHAQNTRL